MQDKQKVTLYLPPLLHRQIKIKAAVDSESMSAVVEKAISFYLTYPEKVEEELETSYGKTHQVHICPECEATMVMQEGQMVSLKNRKSLLEDEFPMEVREKVNSGTDSQGEEKLVAC
jgi:hypothetical protein